MFLDSYYGEEINPKRDPMLVMWMMLYNFQKLQ